MIKGHTNRSLDKQARWYKYIAVQNVDMIHPKEAAYFTNLGKLTPKGLIQYWLFTDELVRLIDNHVPLKIGTKQRVQQRPIRNVPHFMLGHDDMRRR